MNKDIKYILLSKLRDHPVIAIVIIIGIVIIAIADLTDAMSKIIQIFIFFVIIVVILAVAKMRAITLAGRSEEKREKNFWKRHGLNHDKLLEDALIKKNESAYKDLLLWNVSRYQTGLPFRIDGVSEVMKWTKYDMEAYNPQSITLMQTSAELYDMALVITYMTHPRVGDKFTVGTVRKVTRVWVRNSYSEWRLAHEHISSEETSELVAVKPQATKLSSSAEQLTTLNNILDHLSAQNIKTDEEKPWKKNGLNYNKLLEDAFIKKNESAYKDLLLWNVSRYQTGLPFRIDGASEVIKWTKWDMEAFNPQSITLMQTGAELYDRKTLIIAYNYYMTHPKVGDKFTVGAVRKVTRVWVLSRDGWRLAHEHISSEETSGPVAVKPQATKSFSSAEQLTTLNNIYFNVMISSTIHDLPDHRKGVIDSCLRQGMFPIMMEHLPASNADAITESVRMVDKADIYLGIFAYRYGYVPAGSNISITEMEYNRAVERNIPRLIFLMHEDHPVVVRNVEQGEGAIKLENLKKRLKSERVVNFFKSPEDLRAHVINSLSKYR